GAAVEHVVLWQRSDGPPKGGHYVRWEDFIARGKDRSSDVERMEANEPAYMIATSGTTAKPKLAVHTHGGYQVHIASMGKWCFGAAPLLSVDHSRLERVVCAGEVLNAPAWDWLQNTILKNRAPVIDHMWQTETGGPAFGNPYGIDLLPIKPGSATIPLPGIDA